VYTVPIEDRLYNKILSVSILVTEYWKKFLLPGRFLHEESGIKVFSPGATFAQLCHSAIVPLAVTTLKQRVHLRSLNDMRRATAIAHGVDGRRG
jgi:hypothetical protein